MPHELGRPEDGTVDVAFGGEVEHGARLCACSGPHLPGVVYVALNENVARIAAQAVEIAQVAGIGKLSG